MSAQTPVEIERRRAIRILYRDLKIHVRRRDRLGGSALTRPLARRHVGMVALETLRASRPEIPFIAVTAALGDEAAVEYIKRGAADYVLKHRLDRLPAAVGRALRELAHQKEAARLQQQILGAKREWERTFDSVPDPMLIIGEDCRILRANDATRKVFGLTFDQIIGRPCYEVLHGRTDPLPTCPHQCLLITGQNGAGDIEEPRLGKVFHSSTAPLREPDGTLRGCVLVLRDVTERKRAEESLRELTARLLRLQDEERRRIARELHDTTAQGLAGLCLNLSLLGRSAAQWNDKERETLATCRSIAEQSLSELRTMSYLLHPPLLDESGLEPALQWFAEGFTKRSGIRVSFDLAGLARLPRDVELALFRVVQESLGNVHRHSGSKVAAVRIRQDGDVVLEVEDEGFGLVENWDATRGKVAHSGVGIAGMRERVHQLGGDLHVSPRKPRGTIVRAVIPVRKMVDEAADPDS